jgi:O-antigen biosynthesis protein WbqP
MKKNTPELPTHLLFDSNKYLLRIGKYLRKFSLDEFPNLINILKGEMVFVGPRPALHNQYDLIELRKKYGIDKLKPGITGWAQVNGRDELSLEEKCNFDKEYLDKRSLIFDLKILLLTFSKVVLGSNVRH